MAITSRRKVTGGHDSTSTQRGACLITFSTALPAAEDPFSRRTRGEGRQIGKRWFLVGRGSCSSEPANINHTRPAGFCNFLRFPCDRVPHRGVPDLMEPSYRFERGQNARKEMPSRIIRTRGRTNYGLTFRHRRTVLGFENIITEVSWRAR